ncbi:RHS repeat-associated core domain-containing protein [Acidovorax sp. K2F]|uniref:RHS repeat-associated core domain-containing protein n=1 Tax=Acidovorax sp. K2F TaxID=2978125 RepID=UPI0021B119C5|nr:RHS repeat-associated core domain-containing protein [Acidovorax sp. K2F]MCT6721673.1 DUF6531 domain-containing protein [Acidovorax sp. K2F]
MGNPIITATAEKFQRETDYVDQGAHPLTLQRVHRSSWVTKADWPLLSEVEGSPLGKSWVHSFHAAIKFSEPRANKNARALVALENGDVHVFYRTKTSPLDNSTDWKTTESGAQLTTKLNGLTQEVLSYLYTHKETDVQWEFNTLGRLIKRREPNGWTMSYAYSPDGNLQKVTNQFGRSLSFFYDAAGRLTRVRTPDNTDVQYQYGTALSKVLYPDGSQRGYVYEDSRFPLALTGILDELGTRYSTYGYDSTGRAVSTELAGAAYKFTVAYEGRSTTRGFKVTDPLGTVRSYRTHFFSNSRAGVDYMSTPSAEMDDAIFIRGFSAAGLVNETRYFDYWYRYWPTYYQWDETRRLPIQISEGAYSSNVEMAGYVWHSNFRVPVSLNEVKRSTVYSYDANGNRTSESVTDKTSGVVTTRSWTYFPTGLLATSTEANGAVTQYAYDAVGNLSKVIAPNGQQTLFTHDASGRVLTQTSPSGAVTQFTYDTRGRLRSTVTDGLTQLFTYHPTGLIASISSHDGYVLSYTYDPAHRLTGWSDNRGSKGAYSLDAMGNRLNEQVLDVAGQTVWTLSRSINVLNRVSGENLGGSQPKTFEYDTNVDLVKVTNALNEVYSSRRDEKRRLSAVYQPSGAGVDARYDVVNNLLSTTDFKGIPTTFVRDARGNATQETSSDSGTQKATYDTLGLPKQVTDALGRATTITRDALGRPTLLQYADNTSTTLRYDLPGVTYNAPGAPQASVGYLSEVQDSGVTTTYQRDILGRITRKTQTLAGGNTRSISYSYHPAGSAGAGLLDTITYGSGKSLAHVYNSTGQLTALHWNGQPLVTGITWNPLGQPTGWQWSGFTAPPPANAQPLTEQRTYTAAGQLASSKLLQLIWDGAGRISQITQQHMLPTASSTVAQQVGLSSAYTYNSAGRLTASAHSAPPGQVLPSGWSLSDVIGPNSMGYAYDANGNRTQAFYSTTTPAGTATLQRNVQITSGTNRMSGYTQAFKPADSTTSQNSTVSYQLDASGALTKKGDNYLHQTAQGRIAKVSLNADANSQQAINYVYNALAQRLSKSDARLSTTTPLTEHAVYADDGIGSTVLGQYGNRRSATSAAPAGEMDSTEVIYLPTAGGPMPVAAQINGRLYAIESDHLNTPRRLTNTQGQVAWQWLITGFGEVPPTLGAKGYAINGIDNGKVYSEAVSFNLRYPGQQWDEETGLNYNLNRYYDPASGRYIQSDPIGLDGGWNRFGYVDADPLNFADDEGLTRRAAAPTAPSWGQVQLNFQGARLTNQILQYQPNYQYSYISLPGQGYTVANIGQLQGLLQRLQQSSVCSNRSISIEEQAASLVPLNGGRSRVTLRSEEFQLQIDLIGRSHNGIPTPHTKESARNWRAPPHLQPVYNTTERQSELRPATQSDIRSARRYLERRQ